MQKSISKILKVYMMPKVLGEISEDGEEEKKLFTMLKYKERYK